MEPWGKAGGQGPDVESPGCHSLSQYITGKIYYVFILHTPLSDKAESSQTKSSLCHRTAPVPSSIILIAGKRK